MNSRNVKAIKVKSSNPDRKDLLYTVEYFLRVNDFRHSEIHHASKNYGDGYIGNKRERQVLNDHVDEMIANLERNSIDYTLLFEEDLEKA